MIWVLLVASLAAIAVGLVPRRRAQEQLAEAPQANRYVQRILGSVAASAAPAPSQGVPEGARQAALKDVLQPQPEVGSRNDPSRSS